MVKEGKNSVCESCEVSFDMHKYNFTLRSFHLISILQIWGVFEKKVMHQNDSTHEQDKRTVGSKNYEIALKSDRTYFVFFCNMTVKMHKKRVYNFICSPKIFSWSWQSCSNQRSLPRSNLKTPFPSKLFLLLFLSKITRFHTLKKKLSRPFESPLPSFSFLQRKTLYDTK